MLFAQTPDPTSSQVADFCNQVAPGITPALIPCQPVADEMDSKRSVSIVRQHVAKYGGEQVNGWAITETRGLFLEAEAYSAWRDPTGKLVDITPRPSPSKNLLFIQDEKRIYSGPLLDTIRHPLIDDVNVIRFIHALGKHATLNHQLEQAEQQGNEGKADRLDRDLSKLEKEIAQLHARLSRLL